MAVIKCKMCGGSLSLTEDSSVCECEYCGTRQTVPKADDEKKLKLFERAGKLLRGCEFDKAAGVFEAIVSDFPEEAEAYWGLVLCKYGIEYVDDPATGKKVPTCHRSSFDNVMKDSNFEQACENADAVARRVYRDEARAIEELRRGILEVSGKEEPYDVFISYKEKDENGERTPDSVLAQDIYRELTREGWRVFFSRISLENRLGTEYEPYIFAALNSARVMIVVGTDYEHFDAVWVKNEWSRYLKLIAKGERKTLIPVFRDMDAYDMPEAFNNITALDMGRLGAMQDLVHGVEKILGKKNAPETPAHPQQVIQQVIQGGGPNVQALLKRGRQALEDGDWDKARDFYDQVLSMDAENAEAFLGLGLAENRCKDTESYVRMACSGEATAELVNIRPEQEYVESQAAALSVPGLLERRNIERLYNFEESWESRLKSQETLTRRAREAFEQNRNFMRAFRYARGESKQKLEAFRQSLTEKLDGLVRRAEEEDRKAREAAESSLALRLRQADEQAAKDNRQILEQREREYLSACTKQERARSSEEMQAARKAFLALDNYKDAASRAQKAEEEVRRLQNEEAQRRLKAQNNRKKKLRKRAGIIAAVALLALAALLIVTQVIVPANRYKEAEALLEAGQYSEAALAFGDLGDYMDARARCFALWEEIAQRETVSAGDYHTVGLRSDGTVLAVGSNSYGQCDVSGWTGIALPKKNARG